MTEVLAHGVKLTDTAVSKVKALLAAEGRDDLRLRVAVEPGGCSGLIDQLFFDERTLDGDVTTDFDGVTVVVDRMSVPYLNGALIDFGGREYIACTCEATGYQGYAGPGWRGHVMVPAESGVCESVL